MIYKTLVAAFLTSIVLTSSAFAQCADCAIYPNRDHLNGGVETPAGKMGLVLPNGASPAYIPNNPSAATPSNAYAAVRGHYLQRSGASRKRIRR